MGAPMYYRGAAAAIVVYDITDPDSFAGAKSWVKELQRRGDPNVIIALAGNKADLEQRRHFTRRGGELCGREWDFAFGDFCQGWDECQESFCGNCQKVAKESATSGTRSVSN